jgi:transposase
LPKSALGKACDYALNQWSRLIVYAANGEVEIDNDWCENAMRPIALGRKNWLQIGSEEAGPRVAAITSIVETCRRLGINVRDYLLDVLPKIPDWPAKRIAELTPREWAAARTPR